LNCDYRTCRQGGWDDCWFLSALVALGFHRPDDLGALIQPVNDGHFEVSLPNQAALIVKSDANSGTLSEGCWAAAIEIALQQITNVLAPRVFTFGAGITFLTGHGRTGYTNVTGVGFAPLTRIFRRGEWFEQRIAAATTASRLMVLGGSDGYWTTVKVSGLINRHCYALLAYEPEFRTCRLRDPRGDDGAIPRNRKREGYGPGEFWLTLKEVEDSFCGLSIEHE
jgi:hypothetical protein